MGMLLVPFVIVLIVLPGPPASAQTLEDFSRLQQAQDLDVALLDNSGIERIGRVTMATDSDVTLQFGGGTQTFKRTDIFAADRLRDSTTDGAIKGAIVGVLMGFFAMQGLGSDSADQLPALFTTSIGFYGGLGYLFDRMHTARAPIYRAPGAPQPVSVNVRFKF